MRAPLFARYTLPSSRSTPFRISLRLASSSSRRETRGSRPSSKDSAIFNNSLRKTLKAHRSLNRAGLIRKVFDKEPLKAQPLPETSSSVPKEPPHPPVTPRPASPPRPTAYAKKKASRKSITVYPWERGHERVRWAVNAKRNRPEQSPWMAYLEEGRGPLDGLSQLHAEMRALDKYLSPTALELNHVTRVVAEINGLLAPKVPRPPRLIGPWKTGLAMGHSDLEFVLPVPDSARSIERDRKPSATRPQVLQSYADVLRKVEKALSASPLFRDRIRIAGNRNPVLTAIHGPTGMRLQFRCWEDFPSSIEYIRDYHAEYPSVRPLYITSRLILESRGLFGRPNHSIEPDALVMMIVSFLKINHGRFLAQHNSLGAQLLDFLHFYGTAVDLTTTGISVDPPCCFNADTVKEAIKTHDPDLPAYLLGQRALVNVKRTALSRGNAPTASRLCIQDPTNYRNDLGRTCTRTRGLQHALAHAYRLVRASLETPRTSGESLLGPALRANFDDFSQVRARVAAAPPAVVKSVDRTHMSRTV